MQLTLSKGEVRYHPMLIALSYRDWKSRGFEGFPKHPNDFLEIDLDAYNEVLMFSEAVQYIRDESKVKVQGT